MKFSTIRRRIRSSVLVQIGLTWIALLLVPAAMQIVDGDEITTIDNFAPGTGAID